MHSLMEIHPPHEAHHKQYKGGSLKSAMKHSDNDMSPS